jgi:hypothetical protein
MPAPMSVGQQQQYSVPPSPCVGSGATGGSLGNPFDPQYPGGYGPAQGGPASGGQQPFPPQQQPPSSQPYLQQQQYMQQQFTQQQYPPHGSGLQGGAGSTADFPTQQQWQPAVPTQGYMSVPPSPAPQSFGPPQPPPGFEHAQQQQQAQQQQASFRPAAAAADTTTATLNQGKLIEKALLNMNQHIGKVKVYKGATAVSDFKSQIDAALRRMLPGYFAALDQATLASAVVGCLDNSQVMQQHVSSHQSLREPTDVEAVFTTLADIFPTQERAMWEKLSAMSQGTGVKSVDHLAAIKRAHADHRVSFPTAERDCVRLVGYFRSDVRTGLDLAIKIAGAGSAPFTMADLERECGNLDSKAQRQQLQSAAEPCSCPSRWTVYYSSKHCACTAIAYSTSMSNEVEQSRRR